MFHPGYLYWVLCLLKLIQSNVVDKILNFLFGFTTLNGWNADFKKSKMEFESSAQVVNIWWQASIASFVIQDPSCFLFTHSKYINPEEILEMDNATLHNVTPQSVIFVVTDGQVDAHDVTEFPFITLAQWSNAKQLIILPLGSFHKLANKPSLDLTRKEVVFIWNSARCGSTLLCQMFAKMPKTRVLSEPYAQIWLYGRFIDGEFSEQEFKEILKGIIKLECKSETRTQYDRFVIKPSLLGTALVSAIKELCPSIKHVYNTRRPAPSITSFSRLMEHSFYKVFNKYRAAGYWFRQMPFPLGNADFVRIRENRLKPDPARKISSVEYVIWSYAASFASFHFNRSCFDSTITYESLIRDAKGATKRLLTDLDISQSYIDQMMDAMGVDSQSKSFYVQKKEGEKFLVSDEQWTKVDTIFNVAHLPFTSNVTAEAFEEAVKM